MPFFNLRKKIPNNIPFFRDPNHRETFVLEQLDKITFRIRFHRTLKKALEETAPFICQAFRADSLGIWFLQPDQQRLRLEFAYQLPQEVIQYFQQPANYPFKGQGIVGKAFEEQRPVVAKNLLEEKNVPEQWKSFLIKRILKAQTLLSQPLCAENGQLVGVLNLYFGSTREFTSKELLVVKIISNSIGAIIEAQDTYASLEENRNTLKSERDQLAKLYQVVQAIGVQKEVNLQKVVTNLAETVGNALRAKGIGVWKANDEKTYLRVFAHAGISDRYARYFDTHPYPIQEEQNALLVRAFLKRDLKFTRNFWEQEEIIKSLPSGVEEMLRQEQIVSVASAPLIIENETFGVLNFYFSEPHTYGGSEQYILRLVANVIAFTIGNIQYREKLTSNQKELERALCYSEQARSKVEQEQTKTKAIIEKLSDGLIAVNRDGIVEIVNKEAQTLLNVPAGTLVHKSFLGLKTNKNFKALIPIFSKANQEIFRKEMPLPENKTGEITTIPLKIKKSDLGFLVVIHDITREKRVERLKTEFVSLAAHQLRTPTSAIKWALHVLLQDTGKLSEDQKELIQKTYEANERMITLIDDLLNVSRIEEGTLVYKTSLVQIANVIEKQWQLHREEAKIKKLTFSYKKPKGKIPKILIDEEKIHLVIQNLLENAILYTPPRRKIEISLEAHEKEVVISVKDTGIGIPEQEKGEIFQKFYRASNAPKLNTTGSGLGLFISKNIIEAHKGKIWFESQEGKGTTFSVVLPIGV